MKKTLFLFVTLAIFASALGLQVQGAKAEGSITFEEAAYVDGKGFVFIFDAEGFHNRDLRDASIYIGSDFYDLFCWVSEEGDKIICNAQSMLLPFAGQTGIIYLAGYIFYVELPGGGGGSEEGGGGVLNCPEFEVPGADVSFTRSGAGGPDEFFVEGSSIAEVENNAADFVSSSGGFWISYSVVGELYCSFTEEQD